MSEEPELIEPFGAWLARQSDEVKALSTLEQIDLYAEEMEVPVMPYLLDCTAVVLSEVAQGMPQKTVAVTYALALRSAATGCDNPDWASINRAILARWSFAGLNQVKKLAWKLAREGSP